MTNESKLSSNEPVRVTPELVEHYIALGREMRAQAISRWARAAGSALVRGFGWTVDKVGRARLYRSDHVYHANH